MEAIDVERQSIMNPKRCWWLQDLHLEASHQISIVTGKELPEKIINASMLILSQQYPSIDGLQDCSLGRYLRYTPVRTTSTSVQVFHAGKNSICINYTPVVSLMVIRPW